MRKKFLIAAIFLLTGVTGIHKYSNYMTRIHAQIKKPSPLTLGAGFSCFLSSKHNAFCWGNNAHGQIGDGTVTDKYKPTKVLGLQNNVKILNAGIAHACVITEKGNVKCWGNNSSGQLGDGTTTDRHIPTEILELKDSVIDVKAGGNHTCAITPSGGVKCWGSNKFGQLGDGTNNDRHKPVDVKNLYGAIAITLGGANTCALQTDHKVKCWGLNYFGSLGDGTRVNHNTPIEVKNLDNDIIAIDVDGGSSCAITNKAGVLCWGASFFSGDDDPDAEGTYNFHYRTYPAYLHGLKKDVVAISINGNNCALLSNGTVKCWGRHGPGMSEFIKYLKKPTKIKGLPKDITAMDCGLTHCCVLSKTENVVCWGSNSSGELGDGTTMDRLTRWGRFAPVKVIWRMAHTQKVGG